MARDHLEIDRDKYKVPVSYQVKWLKNLGLSAFPGDPKLGGKEEPGDMVFVQNQNMKNEMRVAYLSEELDRLKKIYDYDLKEAY